MRVLVTGGLGFIGSNFIRHVLKERPGWSVVNADALTYAGNPANLADIANDPDYSFVKGDIGDAGFVAGLAGRLRGGRSAIVNFAAESHVDRSVLGPGAFVRTNIQGAFNLLELARENSGVRFVQISTDEVYGSLGVEGRFTEQTPLDPSSPYSASKASADLLVQSYCRTFGVDAVTTRCSNNYGPRQFPEKLIPLMILNARCGKELPVYGTGRNMRDWIHVEDHCRAITAALEKGKSGEVYNFGGNCEKRNIEIVERIADRVAGDLSLIRFVKDRPGHDFRYAMDAAKAKRELGWSPKIGFDQGLEQTIDWYLKNESWWRPILTGEYIKFYDEWYSGLTP
jgi:dTDP-glucose 4,6-dehydratase